MIVTFKELHTKTMEFSEKLPRIVTEKTFISKKSIKETSKYC